MNLLFSNKLWFTLLILATVTITTTVSTNEEEIGGEQQEEVVQVDCSKVCEEQIQPYIAKQAAYEEEKASLVRQFDEVRDHRDRIGAELDQVRKELNEARNANTDSNTMLENTKNEMKQQHINEIEELKKSITATQEEMTHYQKVAQDNQKYMQEYKNQLHSQRDKANKLSEALDEAKAKIVELESTTFIKQLRKEVMMAWDAIVEYWINIKNKSKTETDAEF